MRLPEHTTGNTERACEGAFREARTVPENRRKTSDWACWVLTDAKPDDAARAAEKVPWTTVDACEAAGREKPIPLFALHRALTEGDLARTKWLPFDGGRDQSLAELLDYPRWNLVYHEGQLAYAQILLGIVKRTKRDLAFYDRIVDNSRRSSTRASGKEMRLQDHVIDETRKAMEEAFRYAKAVPQDRLGWAPEGGGRSVLDLTRELAKCPDWAYDVLDKGAMDFSDESSAEMGSWKTVDDCEVAAKEKLGRLFELVKGFPDDRLSETLDLPFGPGGSMKAFEMAELMDYPHWNATYHLGQIAYVQTLYGDRDMH